MSTTVSGQSLHDDLVTRLGGYQNAFEPNDLLSFINEGVAEVWAILRSLDQDYFIEDSQASDSAADDYFAALTTSTREFNLPVNIREMRFIEVTTTGYEYLKFEYRKLSDPEFQEARRTATASGTGSGLLTHRSYLYTIVGKRTFMLAQYPEVALTLKLWFVRALDDIDFTTVVDEILHPFSKKIVTFALERATTTLQDEPLSDRWLERWRSDIRTLASESAPRDSANPVFISDYNGL